MTTPNPPIHRQRSIHMTNLFRSSAVDISNAAILMTDRYHSLIANADASSVLLTQSDISYGIPFYTFLDASTNIIDPYKDNPETKIFFRDEMQYLDKFQEFSYMVNKAYMSIGSKNSTTLDLIALYLKGQKILYTESKTYCEMCLYAIMLPAIFISSGCTVLSISLKIYDYGATIISGLTALNSFLLALITYLKLDAKAEAHKTTAYQFDRLETQCEFLSGEVLLFHEDHKGRLKEFVEEVGKKVQEIKDTNQFIIPEIIRSRYPELYSMNIFSLVNQYKSEQLVKKKELYAIYERIEREMPNVSVEAMIIREDLVRQIIELRNISKKIRDTCYKEVVDYNNARKKNIYLHFLLWLKT